MKSLFERREEKSDEGWKKKKLKIYTKIKPSGGGDIGWNFDGVAPVKKCLWYVLATSDVCSDLFQSWLSQPHQII